MMAATTILDFVAMESFYTQIHIRNWHPRLRIARLEALHKTNKKVTY